MTVRDVNSLTNEERNEKRKKDKLRNENRSENPVEFHSEAERVKESRVHRQRNEYSTSLAFSSISI